MSLELNQGTTPDGVIAVTSFDSEFISLGTPAQHAQNEAIDISMADFCQLALYALTNTDLKSGDPRLHFMNQLAKLNVVKGFNPGRIRLG